MPAIPVMIVSVLYSWDFKFRTKLKNQGYAAAAGVQYEVE